MGDLRIALRYGASIAQDLDALAGLRCRVFRDWPYLYDGSRDYEAKYLQIYVDCPRALAILVWDGDECIGASTVIPLSDAPADMQQPFIDAGIDRSRVDYFGESVLLPPYRGRGLGVKFFELREAHARALNLPVCAFCTVQRPDDHPLRPVDYVSNDTFWHRRGYRMAPELQTTLEWPDVGVAASTRKPMTFWQRELAA
ncbi:MAG: GNAT family N-acetyltransferase [Pseudomonadota bacterium]|nr:GNAT family N-acetyltransferase [Pseudomonadota bacterium]